MKKPAFDALLQPVPHGGLYVIVPKAATAAAGLAHGDRVRGTVDGVRFRSSLMKYSGVFHLGVHKATAMGAEVEIGSTSPSSATPSRSPPTPCPPIWPARWRGRKGPWPPGRRWRPRCGGAS